jgi:hypothetical protein
MKRNERLNVALVVVMFALALSVPGQARTIYVDDDAPADFNTIQAAIDDANSGDTVIIQPGTYTGPGNRDVDFCGKAITVRSEHGPQSCVIDCQGSANELHRGFIFQNGEGYGSVLSGLTITGGYTDKGGAVYCALAGPTIRNCVLTDNTAVDGGAIAVTSANASIEDCLIFRNCAVAEPCSGGLGGGVLFEGCGGGRDGLGRAGCATRPRIIGCTVANNASEVGGGVYAVFGCDVMVANCIIWDNTADQQYDLGLAQYYDIANPTLTVVYSNVKGGLPAIPYRYRVTWGRGNLDVAPGFGDSQTGNYHLSVDSACVDAGDPNYVPSPNERDIDGEPRMMNARVDIGADELTAALIPTLAVSKSQFRFDANESEANPTPQSLIIYNAVAESQLAWGIVHDCSWLGIDPVEGCSSGETQEVILAPDISNVARGLYVCEVKVGSKEALRSPQTVRVELAVHGPMLDLSTLKLSFQAVAGRAGPPTQILRLVNRGSRAVVWTCQKSCDWVSVYPTSGTTTESEEITVAVDPMRLVGGTYKCELAFLDSNAERSPQTVVVTATLADDDGLLEVPAEYPTIQAAIDAASNGEYVLVMPGPYRGPGNRDLDLRGKAITVGGTDPNDPAIVAATVIDCQGTKAEPHRGFNLQRNEKGTTVVEGLTVTGGYAEIYGGGMYIDHSSPVVRRCVVQGNYAAYDGAGVACTYSSAMFLDCRIIGNRGGHKGGGLWCKGTDGIARDCVISRNNADQGGGACFEVLRYPPSLCNCLLVSNTARQGGGLFITGQEGKATISQCTIVWNTATEGGGVCCEATDPELSNCILWANTATRGAEIALTGPAPVSGFLASCAVRYCDVRGGVSGVYVTPQSRLDWGIGNINGDPLFANWAGDDYHLKSQAGRWEASSQTWVTDDVTSPCIDAGDPNSLVGDEPEPNGGRINMGAYGGTAEASKSYSAE